MSNKEDSYNKALSAIKNYMKCYHTPQQSLPLITRLNAAVTVICDEFKDFNFVGFYMIEKIGEKESLVCGPYNTTGLPTPIIDKGNGVCGTCWALEEIRIENDVTKCKNYIACSGETKSEIVVPLFNNSKKMIGLLDIDSTILNKPIIFLLLLNKGTTISDFVSPLQAM